MITPDPEPRRGEIWYARFDPVVGHEQGGERPCLVISDDRFNHSLARLVIVLPITRTERGLASHVQLASATESGALHSSQVRTAERRKEKSA